MWVLGSRIHNAGQAHRPVAEACVETVKRTFNQLGGTGTSLKPGSTKEIPYLWHRQN
jgi:hypothetical protein